MTLAEKWLAESEENRRMFAEEGLIIQATEGVFGLLIERGKTQADLSKMLGQTKSHVTQLLNGSRNMTLRTLARIAYSMDAEVKLEFVSMKR